MNTALKHWKEAATVVLAAGTKHKRSVECLWGEAAGSGSGSHPGLAHLPPKSAFDYEVLLLRRSSRSGFMPGAYVFPGGLVDPADFSRDWLEGFKAFTHLPNFGLPVVKQPIGTRPPMFATDRTKLGSPIPGDVAFRICAVRETFEESGVLLVVPRHEAGALPSAHGDNEVGPLTSLARLWDQALIRKWRSLVLENSSNFIRMCSELQCLPNIWALHEWANWLTPKGVFAKQRRYDTAFYICCLEEIPDTAQDQKEIVKYKWSTPPEILHSYRQKEFWIAPPQFYDLCRICRVPSLSDLHGFAKQRSVEGCEHWLPVMLTATDGQVSLLPGDGLYAETAARSEKTDGKVETEKSLDELERETLNLHRFVYRDLYETCLYINITPKYQHLPPLTDLAPPGTPRHRGNL